MADTPAKSDDITRIDWDHARQLMRGVISRQLHSVDPSTVEDLTQEALVRFLRALRREAPREPDALATSVAKRTAIDHLRSKTRWKLIVEPMSDAVEDNAASTATPPDQFGDPVTRVRFLVMEFFRENSARCLELAHEYFQENDWKTVGARLGSSHGAVRRQWSRCVDTLREALQRNPAMAELSDWATGG